MLTGILANITIWLLTGIIDMFIALVRRDGVNTPGTVLSAMFQCWRDAFEDFVPGLKAEWKAVFANKVVANPTKAYDNAEVGRIASANGACACVRAPGQPACGGVEERKRGFAD